MSIFRTFIIIGIFWALSALSEAPTVDQITAARHVIAECLINYNKARDVRSRIEKKKFRSIFKRKRYTIDLAIYDEYFDQFTRFQSEERAIMAAPSGEKMRELAVAYSSNCKRFADGILALAAFSRGKTVQKDYARNFRRQRKEYKKKIKQEVKNIDNKS